MSREFTASKTIQQFMNSSALVRVILGPVGSGKSTGCLMELVRRMAEQDPGPDNVRHTRWAVVRQTLQQLKLTVLKEFYTWIGPITEYKVSDSTVFVRCNDISSEFHLIPLEDEKDQRRLLSMQLTGAWINEFPEIDPNLVPPIIGRLGRYPQTANWYGLVMDGNFPTAGSDWYDLLETNRPANWDVHKQPSGLSDHAENLNWLLQTKDSIQLPFNHPARLAAGRQYYLNQMQGQSPAWIKRYVLAEYGDDPGGSAVFRTTFHREVHVVDSLTPVPGRLILIGQDFGRDPCSVICQVDPRGRMLVLEEVLGEDIGLEQHVATSLRPVLIQPRYLGAPVAIIGDPAGIAKDNLFEVNSFDVLKRMGFSAQPAPTNDPDLRIGAVEALLLRTNGIVIDGPKCPRLVRGMAGGYRYTKTSAGVRKPRPDKDDVYSHVVDALQYACLVVNGGMVDWVASRAMHRPRGNTQPSFSAAGWT